MRDEGEPRAEASRGDVAADRIDAREGAVAAGIIYGGVHYGHGGPVADPIQWRGRLAEAPASILGVAPLPGDRREFATYVERDQDGELRELIAAEPFVIVRGPSLAGKSRTLHEAARALLPGATVFVPNADRPDALADLEGQLPTDGEAVIWLDDLDRYVVSTGTRLSSGLTFQQLEGWLEPARRIHVLATIRVDAWRDVTRGMSAPQAQPPRGDRHPTQRSDRTGWDVLKRGALLELEGPASARELELAEDTFDEPIPEGLSFGEYLYSIPHLLDLLETAELDERAIVWAAADWRRMTGAQTIQRDRLREHWAAWLRALGRPALERRFEPALEFALTSKAESWLALLTEADEATFSVPDYFVAFREGGVEGGEWVEIPDDVWRVAMGTATAETLVTIGLRADAADSDSVAREAWGKAFGASGDDVSSANAGFLLAVVHLEDRTFPEGIAIGERLWTTFGETTNPEVRAIVAAGLVNLAETYAQSGDLAAAATTDERLIAQFGEATENDTRQSVAQGMHNLALHQAQAGRLDDAIATGQDLITRFGDAIDNDIRQSLAGGLYNLGLHQAQAGRLDEAIAIGERLYAEFGDSMDYDIRQSVAGGLRNLAIDQAQAGRLDEAIASGERLFAEFGEAWEPEVRESVAAGLRNLAIDQAKAGRLDEAIATGKRIVAEFADDWGTSIGQSVAEGMVNLAVDQADAGQLEDAIATGEDLMARYGDTDDPMIRVSVAQGEGNLAAAQVRAGNPQDAIATGERLIAKFDDAREPTIREAIAVGLRVLAAAQADAGRLDEAIATGERLVAKFADATEPTVSEGAAWGWHNLALALADSNRLDDAVSTGQQLVARFGDVSEPPIQEVVASALGNLALHHTRREDIAASIAARDRLLSVFAETTDAAIREGLAGDLASLAEDFAKRGEREVATTTAEAIVAVFGESSELYALDAVRRAKDCLG